MKKFLMCVMASLCSTIAFAQKDEVVVKDVTMFPGGTAQMEVALNNPSKEYTALQFKLSLPEGISIAPSDNGKSLKASLNRAVATDHELVVSQEKDNTYIFIVFSRRNAAFTGAGTIASITAIQPVFAGGQIINGNKLAKIGEEVSRLRQQLSEDEVETTAEQYFWQLVTLEEKQRTIASVEEMLADIHKDVNLAVEAGLTLRNDLLKVELRQNEVESQKVKIQNGMALVKMLLAQYCGLRDTSFTLRYTTEAISPISIKRDHQQALLNTPEYQLLDKQVEATSLQKKMAVGENLPSVAVGAGYNYHNLLGSDQTFGMIFATVSVPLSNWWGGSHAIKRKKIAQQQAIRMQKAWNDVEEAYQQLHIAERSIRQAEENLRLSRNCYQAGTTTMSDLLEAQMLYQQSLDKHTDAFADYQNKILAYKHAVGM